MALRLPAGAGRWWWGVSALEGYSPATDDLIAHLTATVEQVRTHDHQPNGQDIYCLNLVAYMGERMGPVLRRLAEAEAGLRGLATAKPAGVEVPECICTDSNLPARKDCTHCYPGGEAA